MRPNLPWPSASPRPGATCRVDMWVRCCGERAAGSLAGQRQDGAGHARGGRPRDRAAALQRPRAAGLRLHLLLPHPGVRAGHGLPVPLVQLHPTAPVGAGHDAGHAVRDLLVADGAVPAPRRRRPAARPDLDQPPLADVVPRRPHHLAPGDPGAQGALGDGPDLDRRQPAGGRLRPGALRPQPGPGPAALLRDRAAPHARRCWSCPSAASPGWPASSSCWPSGGWPTARTTSGARSGSTTGRRTSRWARAWPRAPGSARGYPDLARRLASRCSAWCRSDGRS